jgi:transposase InsO family protein
MSQNDCIGKTLKPWPILVDHYNFIDCVVENMPFPIRRIQTERGREFFAEKVQKQLMIYGIKFRPNKPGSPHLNGKVERSQKTDKSELYPTIDVSVGLE